MTTMKVVKLSICSCGFQAFEDVVALGDSYEVALESIQDAICVCGGCKKEIPIHAIWAINQRDAGWLPLEALGKEVN